jgi:hypothetical protein
MRAEESKDQENSSQKLQTSSIKNESSYKGLKNVNYQKS